MFQRIEHLLLAKKFAEAEAEAQHVVLAHPTNARAQALLGLALFRQGKWMEATAPLRSAVTLEPGFADAAVKLAQSLDRLQRYEEALQVARDCYQHAPNNLALNALLNGLSRHAREDRTDAWEQSVMLDRHRVMLARED